jgi:hypothetical protein
MSRQELEVLCLSCVHATVNMGSPGDAASRARRRNNIPNASQTETSPPMDFTCNAVELD